MVWAVTGPESRQERSDFKSSKIGLFNKPKLAVLLDCKEALV